MRSGAGYTIPVTGAVTVNRFSSASKLSSLSCDAQLGDQRRTKRLIRMADQMVRRPGGTLPQKFNSPKDLRAAYRFFQCDDVSHRAILEPLVQPV